MSAERNKRNAKPPDDFPLTVSFDVSGGDEDGGIGLPGSEPPAPAKRNGGSGTGSNVVPKDDNSSTGSSDFGENDSDTAINHNRTGEGGEAEAAPDAAGEKTAVKDRFQKQYRNVRWIKIAVITLLILTAIGVTCAVYFFTRTDEQARFKLAYDNFAEKVADSFVHNMDMKVYTAFTLSASFGTYRSADGTMAWPNVTIPAFSELTLAMPLLAHSWNIGFSPVVTSEDRSEWEAYATAMGQTLGLDEVIALSATMGHSEHGSMGGHDGHSHTASNVHSDHSEEMNTATSASSTHDEHNGGMARTSDVFEEETTTAHNNMEATHDSALDNHGHHGRHRRAQLRGGYSSGSNPHARMAMIGGTSSNLRFVGFASVSPLGLCQGSCSDDSDCQDHLICLERRSYGNLSYAETLAELGCVGRPVTPVSYCVDNIKHSLNSMQVTSTENMNGMGHHEGADNSGTDKMHQGMNDTRSEKSSISSTMESGHSDMKQNGDMGASTSVGDIHGSGYGDEMVRGEDGMVHDGNKMTDAEDGMAHNQNDITHSDVHVDGDMDVHGAAMTHVGDHGDDEFVASENLRKVEDGIYRMSALHFVDEDDPEGPYFPLWQVSPLAENAMGIMFNQYSIPVYKRAIDDLMATNHPTLTEMLLNGVDYHPGESHHATPSSTLFYPVLDSMNNHNGSVVGVTSISFNWESMLMNILPNDIIGMVCVLETITGQAHTYELNGNDPTFVGEGDLHNEAYDHMMKQETYQLHGVSWHVDNHHMDHRRHLCEDKMQRGRRAKDEDTSTVDHHDDGMLMAYTIKLYPSEKFENEYKTREPIIYAIAVAMAFVFTSLTFFIYDCLVERRQTAVMRTAEKSSKIVHSLFPAVVRDRLFHTAEEEIIAEEEKEKKGSGIRTLVPKAVSNIVDTGGVVGSSDTRRMSVTAFLGKHHSDSGINLGDDSTAISGQSPPIADLFTDTTILFADIAGFTAWSSEREPAQVFQLLEALFKEFDTEAKKHGVFKVETIGDCYVAVTGLPNPRADHAVAMTRFAQNCLIKFHDLTNELELSLGPGTGDLGMRVGLHSGPVTAGVLRGEKSRFQLFGDTMNTASRMESTGRRNMIQVSQQTAELLISHGKERYLSPREDLVNAKGKGTLKTYWVLPRSTKRTRSLSSGHSGDSFDDLNSLVYGASDESGRPRRPYRHDSDSTASGLVSMPPKRGASMVMSRDVSTKSTRSNNGPEGDASWKNTGIKDAESIGMQPSKLVQRLIKWNAAVLEKYLVKVILVRSVQRNKKVPGTTIDDHFTSCLFSDEIAEAVEFRHFDRQAENQFASIEVALHKRKSLQCITKEAREELLEYVGRIASMYKNVHFHNFEHASHVTMSASKLMNKVCSRDNDSDGSEDGEEKRNTSVSRQRETGLFFSTFGISSDPLAQLAVVFAALVHDVDHTGVPNTILIGEKPNLGAKYNNKSVAENNSIHVAWRVLMEKGFENLRACMFGSDNDRNRFRQLLINVVIATDIADRERKKKEQDRWKRAFQDFSSWDNSWEDKNERDLAKVDVSLKATVVLEQIVLASDVAHTMQHWLTFIKWNERLYRELWAAYVSGRAKDDPTVGWYKGQIGFFDGYIIPLATKLKECGVFGTAGEEYLGNALSNREEWIQKGEAISAEFDKTIKFADAADNEPNYWTSH